MKKEERLVNKLKRLLRRLNIRRYLHHFGPKTYEFVEHLSALLIRFFCKMSYRRTKYFLDLLGMSCPSKSSLQRTAKKLSADFWQKLLQETSGCAYLVALDATGFSRENPSYYYLKRIDGKMPKVPVKLSVAFDTRKKKFCAARVKVLPAHDIKDVEALLRSTSAKVLVAGKAYDARWVHELCRKLGIEPQIPVRNWGKPRFRNM